MKVFAFIPARGGSKRIERKNLALVGARSLLHRAVAAASGATNDVSIWVSTDDAEIAQHARDLGVRVHERPAQLATDYAQIESAMSHWYTRLGVKPDVIVLLQPTSPYRTAVHVRAAVELLAASNLDSVIGVTVSHEPHFAGRLKPREILGEERGGHATPNVPFFEWQPFAPVAADSRPRTQDLPPRGHENGSLYAFTRAHWEATGNRMGGRMAALPMTRWEGLDVDTQEDLDMARAISEASCPTRLKAWLRSKQGGAP